MTVVLDAHGTAFEQAERLTNALAQGEGEESLSPWGACLTPLLGALNWRGEPRHIAESLPHFANSLDLEELRAVLARGPRTAERLGGSCWPATGYPRSRSQQPRTVVAGSAQRVVCWTVNRYPIRTSPVASAQVQPSRQLVPSRR